LSTNETRQHNWRVRLTHTTNPLSRISYCGRVIIGSLTTLKNSDNKLHRDTVAPRSVLDGRSVYEFRCEDQEELKFKAWSGGNGSIEFRMSGVEETYQFGNPFFCFFSTLLFELFSHLIGSQPSINSIGTGFTISRPQSMRDGVSLCPGSTEWRPDCANQ
jgi:hypothetical protein